MTLSRYAIVDANGNVINVVEFEDAPTEQPDDGTSLVAAGAQRAEIGYTYANGVFTNPNPDPTMPMILPNVLAQSLLDKSDVTLVRCVEAGVTIPQAWKDYRDALRLVVKGTSTTMPAIPSYPSGT